MKLWVQWGLVILADKQEIAMPSMEQELNVIKKLKYVCLHGEKKKKKILVPDSSDIDTHVMSSRVSSRSTRYIASGRDAQGLNVPAI